MGCIDGLCFGSETDDINIIMSTAKALDTPAFSQKLKKELKSGVSFPTARQLALEAMGEDGSVLETPNAILAVENCKALLRRNSAIQPLLIHREGDYHGGTDPDAPSASFLRTQTDWHGYVPEDALACFAGVPRHSVAAGQRAWLARLRSMEEAEFERLPFGSEGLWRKVLSACRTEPTLEAIVQAAKSKRYTRTRLMRLLLCAYLGITEEMLAQPAPYVRVLAVNGRGQRVLRQVKQDGELPLLHTGQRAPDCAYAALERRAADLFPLFCEAEELYVNLERKARIFRIP